MAARNDLTDRNGKSKEMSKRTMRLTDTENYKLNKLLSQSGITLRDYMANLIEIEYKKIKGEDENDK